MRNTSAFQPKSASGINRGLVSYWALDESSGNITDSVSNNTGTNTGVTFTTGKINNAASFGETNFFDCGSNSSLQLSVFTFACWVNTSDTTNNKTIVVGNSAAGSGFQWRIETNLKQQLNKQGSAGIGTSTTAISSGVWQHVAVSYNASTGAYQFYLNGTTDGSGTSAQTLSQNRFYIGYNNASEGFIGLIDELGVWNRILTSDEISELYNSGSGRQLPTQGLSTRAYYPLDGSSTDYSGNTNTGTDTSITYPQGRFGKGALFNGTSSLISIADNASIDLTTNITFSCWIKLNSLSNDQDIASKWTDTSNQRSWIFRVNPTAQTLVFIASDSGADPTVTSSSVTWTPRLGKYYHVGFTYESGTVNFFVDGVRQGATQTGARSPLFNSSAALRLGCRFTSVATEFFNGIIDEVIFESRAWSAQEFSAYYRKSIQNYRQKGVFQIVYTYTSELLKGTYTQTGKNLTTLQNYVGTILKGTYTLTGKNLDVARGYIATLGAGIYNLVGKVIKTPTAWIDQVKSSTTWSDSNKSSATTWTEDGKSSTTWTESDKS